MEFTIDRDKWLRGEGHSASKLLRPSDGKMCCLGMYLLACGLTPEEIQDQDAPGDVAWNATRVDGMPRRPIWNEGKLSWLLKDNANDCSETCVQLMSANDDQRRFVEETNREEKVAELFAKEGITVHFIG